MSLVNTAVTAVVAALSAAPAVGAVSRVRLRPLAATATTQVVVRPVDTQVLEAELGPGYPVSWQTRLGVECYARSTSATAPDVAVDALVSSVYARLMSDTTLGGQVVQLQPQSLSYDFDADGDQTVCATFVFLVLQRAAAATF